MNFFTKKSFIIFALIATFCIFFNKGFSQITVAGSTSQDGVYTSLTNAAGAFLALNGTSQAGRTITISITADVTTEAGTNALTGAAGMWTTLTISPSGGAARTISGAFANGLITFTNADNVTIDGLNSGGNSLIIANTTAGATANAIRFIDDASNNIIRNCTIRGSNTSATSGVILFSTTANTTGNDNNLITLCDIGLNAAAPPANCIYAAGTATKENDNNTISNCNIHDFFLATGASGILIAANNSGWTISGNSFYLVSTRDGTYNIIKINNTSGVGFTVSGNYLGGDSPLAAVTTQKFTVNSPSEREFIGIYLNVGTSSGSTVQNNFIKNISYTADAVNTYQFNGIYVAAGDVLVDLNTIGDNLTGSIILTISNSGANICSLAGIYYAGVNSVTNNIIGSITVGGPLTNLRQIRGIRLGGALTKDISISGNTIGNATTANSFQTTTTTPSYVAGIYSQTTGTFNISFSNNVIANLTEASANNSTSTVLYGITTSDAGVVSIINNSVHDLTSATTNQSTKGTSAYLAFIGIAGADGVTITGNSIYNMKLTSASVTPLTSGIFVNHGTGNVISKNIIYNLESAADGTMLNGIWIASSDATPVGVTTSNNMIRLGYKSDGTSVIFASFYTGILKTTTGACNFYFNSVYVGGTNVNNVAANYSSCFEREQNGSDICKNNIFQNTRANAGAGAKHYSIVLNTTTTFTSDYNDLYTTSVGPNNLGSYDGGTTPRDFTAWKTGTSQDANSVNEDANFISPTTATPNLHINPGYCGVNDNGIVISGITTDYDGNNRATGTAVTQTGPDIGADEYSGNIDPDTVMTNCSQSILLTVASLGAGSLQWQESDDNGATDVWANAVGGSGATTANYTTASLTGTIYFRVAVTNGGCTEYTNSVMVKIDPTITVQPLPTTACVGLSTSLSVTAEGSGITYQWQISTTGAGGPFSNISDAGVYSNATTATLNISDATGLNGNYYRCVVTSCAFPVNSDPALLTVTGISTRYWAGAGTVLTGGTAGTDFNADGNWSTTGPTGAATLGTTAPSTCTDVIFTVTNTNTITFSANTTINSLTMSHSGTNDVFTLVSAFNFTINGVTTANVTGGNVSTYLRITVDDGGSIVYGGNTTFSGTTGLTFGIRGTSTTCTGTFTFKGNVNFNAGFATSTFVPDVIYFDGSGTQSIANNQNSYIVELGTTSTQIGSSNSPTVNITSNNTNTMRIAGNLLVNNNSTLDLSTFTLNRSAAGGSLTLASGATMRLAGLTAASNYPLNFTTSTLNGTVEYYAAGGQTISRTSTPTNLALTYNNLTLSGSGAKTLAANTTVNGTLAIGGTGPATFALGGFVLTYGAAAKLKYNASVAQATSNNEFPSPFTPTGGVEIANSVPAVGAGVTLSSARTINSTLTLTDGNLITTSGNILTMAAGSSASSGSAASFVDGPMIKVGGTDFVFPVGDYIDASNCWWRRIGISNLSGSETFTAEYFKTIYSDMDIKTQGGGAQMDAISALEYWSLDRLGSVDAEVKLFWENATSSGIDDCADLLIAHFNTGTTEWENSYDGSYLTTGTCSGTNSGSVYTTVRVTSFSPFAFGSKGAGKNPLPVELLSFTAYPVEGKINLLWATATEVNNNYFTIERSKDGREFEELAIVKSKAPGGNGSIKLDYFENDPRPYNGLSYYRLKQTDFDGKYSYSNIVAVNLKENEVSSLFVFPNPANNMLNIVIGENEKSTLIIYDVTGQVVLQSAICNQQSSICNVDIAILSQGIYFISLSDGVETKHARFVKN